MERRRTAGARVVREAAARRTAGGRDGVLGLDLGGGAAGRAVAEGRERLQGVAALVQELMGRASSRPAQTGG